MSMVAFGATRGAIDISFPGATITVIGWPYSKAGLWSRSSVNDVAIVSSVNDVLIFINKGIAGALLNKGPILMLASVVCRSCRKPPAGSATATCQGNDGVATAMNAKGASWTSSSEASTWRGA